MIKATYFYSVIESCTVSLLKDFLMLKRSDFKGSIQMRFPSHLVLIYYKNYFAIQEAAFDGPID